MAETKSNTQENETAKPAKIVDDDIIDNAVKFINEKANEIVYIGYVEIGKHILEKFFKNDLELASSKNPRKEESFNRLCERDDLVVQPNQLSLMVRVAAQEEYFSKQEITTNTLSYTHKASLVKMDNGDQKTEMVKQCVENKWSTRQLDEAIKEHLKALPQSSISKASLIRTTNKYITKFDDLLKTVDASELSFDLSDFSSVNVKKVESLKEKINTLRSKAKESINNSTAISKECDNALEKLNEVAAEKKVNSVKPGRPAKKK